MEYLLCVTVLCKAQVRTDDQDRLGLLHDLPLTPRALSGSVLNFLKIPCLSL